MTPELLARARAILTANDRGGYTVPTDGLYPFQWNWDSAFVAMGFATFDIDRALRELECLAEGQWDDGMIPQIIFHAPAESYFPGPEVWGTAHRISTSGITQPPVFAIALNFIAARAGREHRVRIRRLIEVAAAYHAWFAKARDPGKTGLVGTLHNWETGRDNSPEWDEPFARVPDTPKTPIHRRDTGHVDAAMRPSDTDYRRYIHLVDTYRALRWSPVAMWSAAPFKVADIGTNAILLAAEEALIDLARHFDLTELQTAAEHRMSRLATGLQLLWSEKHQWYLSRDLMTDSPLEICVSAGLLSLLTDVPSREAVAAMAARLERHLDTVDVGVASTLPGEPGFEPKRYWRGPVWAIINWMIAEGLARHGQDALAARLRRVTARMITRGGFAEYFDPLTGAPLGGDAFSWTASIALVLSDCGLEKNRLTPARRRCPASE
jgi:hypothetical protein